jgi:hypothetical protein
MDTYEQTPIGGRGLPMGNVTQVVENDMLQAASISAAEKLA